MKTPCFQIGDKVTFKPEYAGLVFSVPTLLPGRVYCVERINIVYGKQWLRLVGVREHKIKNWDDRGCSFMAFDLAHRSIVRAKKGGV